MVNMNGLRAIYTLLLITISVSYSDMFNVKHRPVACDYECNGGACLFENCQEPVYCGGGACKFVNCVNPVCNGKYIYISN